MATKASGSSTQGKCPACRSIATSALPTSVASSLTAAHVGQMSYSPATSNTGRQCRQLFRKRGVLGEAGVEPFRSCLRELGGLRCGLLASRRAPPSVQQRRRQPAQPLEFLRRCGLRVEGGKRLGVPRLVRPSGEHLVDAEVGLDPDDPQRRVNQHKMRKPFRISGCVEKTGRAAGRMSEQVHPVAPDGRATPRRPRRAGRLGTLRDPAVPVDAPVPRLSSKINVRSLLSPPSRRDTRPLGPDHRGCTPAGPRSRSRKRPVRFGPGTETLHRHSEFARTHVRQWARALTAESPTAGRLAGSPFRLSRHGNS